MLPVLTRPSVLALVVMVVLMVVMVEITVVKLLTRTNHTLTLRMTTAYQTAPQPPPSPMTIRCRGSLLLRSSEHYIATPQGQGLVYWSL